MATGTLVSYRVNGDLGELTLNRPSVRNALNPAVYIELASGLTKLEATPHVRFVVLRGVGTAFSSGGDRNAFSAGVPDDYLSSYVARMDSTISRIRTLSKVVVSVVQGPAVGAGAALALSADIVLAARSARFRFSFVHVGAVPDAGSSWILPRLVGLAHARELILTGRWLGAEEAQRMGAIARVADDHSLEEKLGELIGELRHGATVSTSMAKHLIDAGASSDLANALRMEGIAQNHSLRQHRGLKGVSTELGGEES